MLNLSQPASFFLPFFAAWSSLPSSDEELALRQHFCLALFAVLHAQPALITHVQTTVSVDMWTVSASTTTHF